MAETRLGRDRIDGAYAWRGLVDAGARLAGGSDFPVEDHNPLWGIYAAVSRQDHDGNPPGGWHPEERLTMPEALDAFTAGVAYAAFRESKWGRLVEDMWADMIVLDRDVTRGSPSDLLSARVVATMVGGSLVSGELPAAHGVAGEQPPPN